MKDHDTTTASHIPSIRIWLCGPLQIEWIDPLTGQTSVFTEQDVRSTTDATQVLSLLKILLCQPGRQAHRDWLLEQFWPEHAHSAAIHRFHNITSAFRKLLCPPDGISLLPTITGKRDSGSYYALPAYPRLWVDRDAALWNVEQAVRMQRFGDDAFLFWQRAYELLKRGPFLADELYAEWANACREELEGCYRQCVHSLWRLCIEQHGEAGKAEALLLLRTYWQEHKTDEDALRPLMELLGEQERYQEAEAYYQQMLHALAELEADEDGGSPREPDERTRDIRAYLRTKHIQRRPMIAFTGSIAGISPSTPALPSNQHVATPNADLAPIIAQDIMKTIRELEGTADLKFSEMIHRRAVLAHLFSLPPAVLATNKQVADTVSDVMMLQEEALSSLYEDMLIMGWDSFRRSKSPQIITKIDEHVMKLSALTRSASARDEEHWQSLFCRFSQLSTRIAQHCLNESRALSMAKQAIMIAIDLDDAELIASAFYGRGRVHMEYSHTARDGGKEKRHFERAKADIDAALGHVERVRVPLAGNIYLLAAEIYALIAENDRVLRTQCEKWQDKVAFLVESKTIEDDGTFLKLNPTALHHERAKTLLRFGKIEEAQRELTIAWETLQPNLFTWHMNMHLTQSALFLAEQDIEASAKSGLKAHTLAKTIHSHKGEVEVQCLLERLQQVDQANSSLRELAVAIRENV